MRTEPPGARSEASDRGSTVQHLVAGWACLSVLLGSVGCTALSSVYDAVAPPVQYDHEKSELGLEAVKDVDDYEMLRKIPGSEFSLQRPKKLNPELRTYLLLQVDGGGIMGITPAILVSKIEAALRKRRGFGNRKLNDVVSLCSGTSTGAIITGAVAAGVPGERIAEFYASRACELFQSEGRLRGAPIFQNKLNRELFQEEMLKILKAYSDYPPTVRLGELDPVPSLILTGYDLVSKRTVFLRNCDDLDSAVNAKDMQLIDAISASALSAAVYFGKLPAPEVRLRQLRADGHGYEVKGAIFADGGQGTQNTTIALTALEALRIKAVDPGAQVVLISLGCGNDFSERNFDEVLKFRAVHHIQDFLFRNQARSESILLQWMAAMKIEETVDDLVIFRFDWHHTSDQDATPFSVTPRQRQFLIAKAEEIAARKDFAQLLRDLSDNRLRFVQARR